MPSESLRIEDQPGAQPRQRILRLDGPLVMATIFEFQATVRADTSRSLIIDFTNVPYVDSAGSERWWGPTSRGRMASGVWRWWG